ncbi:MAG: nucleotidyltransferase domain-containing protein [Geminicoccaceae bacterium]
MPTLAEIDLVTELKAQLARRAAELRSKGIREVALIGSRARGTATADSDIDLLLDLTPDATFGLLDLVTGGRSGGSSRPQGRHRLREPAAPLRQGADAP